MECPNLILNINLVEKGLESNICLTHIHVLHNYTSSIMYLMYLNINMCHSTHGVPDFTRCSTLCNLISLSIQGLPSTWYRIYISNVLIVWLKDLDGNVRRIAAFLNIELSEEEINRVVTDNTFENKKKKREVITLFTEKVF